MKTIKKLSIALLLSITSLQITQAMEGPEVADGPVSTVVAEPAQTGPSEAEKFEGEEGNPEGSPGSTVSEGQRAAQSGRPEGEQQEGSTQSGVTDEGQKPLEGSLDVEPEQQPMASKAAKLFGVDPVTREQLTSGREIEKQTRSFSQKVKDLFSKIGNGLASPFKAFGKMLRENYSRLKQMISRNNSSLPEAEQVAPSAINAEAEAEGIKTAIKARLEAGGTMTPEEVQSMKETFKDALRSNEGLSSDDLTALEEMVDAQVDAARLKLESDQVSANKKATLSELLGKTPLFTGEGEGEGADKVDGDDSSSSSSDTTSSDLSSDDSLFEGEGEEVSTPTTTPSEPANTLTADNVNEIFDGFNDASLAEQKATLNSIDWNNLTQGDLELISSHMQEMVRSAVQDSNFKAVRKRYNAALEGTRLRVSGSGKVIIESKEQTAAPSSGKGKRGRRSRSRR